MDESKLLDILERLNRIETKIDMYKVEVEQLKNENKWIFRTCLGAFLTALASIFSILIN